MGLSHATNVGPTYRGSNSWPEGWGRARNSSHVKLTEGLRRLERSAGCPGALGYPGQQMPGVQGCSTLALPGWRGGGWGQGASIGGPVKPRFHLWLGSPSVPLAFLLHGLKGNLVLGHQQCHRNGAEWGEVCWA